jgi:hypothetical protein
VSHITEGRLQVSNLESVREGGEAAGFVFMENQRTHAWYGVFMNDSEEGRRVAAERGVHNLGRCDHALRLKDHRPGLDYEVGVVANPDGTYSLLYDTWGPGARLEAETAGGRGLSRLKQECAVAEQQRAAVALQRAGFRMVREDLLGGTVRLRYTR